MKPNRVEIILTGGIGNQLFQYAFGRYLSLKEKIPLSLNVYKYGIHTFGETKRNFGLENFNLSCELIHQERIIGKNRFLDRLLKYGFLRKFKFEGDSNSYAEINWGYWLNQSYSNEIKNDLLNDLSLKDLPEELKDSFQKFESQRILGIHIRRGDYVTNSGANKTHGLLGLDYYLKAINLVEEKVGFEDVYFFTDDPKWVSENFKDAKIFQQNIDPVFDLVLMSKASALIISNSTFSWWAAWLNQKSECTVAPKKWFVTFSNPDIYDPDWHLL